MTASPHNHSGLCPAALSRQTALLLRTVGCTQARGRLMTPIQRRSAASKKAAATRKRIKAARRTVPHETRRANQAADKIDQFLAGLRGRA